MSNLRFEAVSEASKRKPVEVTAPSERPSEFFGKKVFNRQKMYKYLPADVYEKLVAATSRDKVAALAEVGYLPDVDLLQKSRIPWAYYMTWSKEFCISEKYNSVENLKKMYDSEYAVTL